MKVENKMKVAVVTGAAGFVGSNLVDDLLRRGISVIGIDNLSTGRIKFLHKAMENTNFTFLEKDLFLDNNFEEIFKGSDTVFHLAANADVRFGPEHPIKDFEQNTFVTQKMLEATRVAGVKKFVFSSTGSVYGESEVIPTPENAPFPIQTSLYGASKLACEGLITSYAEAFGIQVWIFRLVSILGPRYTHGHVFDFYKQLKNHPEYLTVLGNGNQRKSYLHVLDCMDAINRALENTNKHVNIFNIGSNATCDVRDSIKLICNEMQLDPIIKFGIEERGWVGDNPLIHLSTEKIRNLGWESKFTIEESIKDTVKFMKLNSWIFD